VKGLFDILAELTGLKSPTIKLPFPVLRLIAGGMELASKVTGTRPMLDRTRSTSSPASTASSAATKAKRELGYTYLSARDTLRRTVAWLIDAASSPRSGLQALRPHPSLRGAYEDRRDAA
jgi:hypothetical protein